jgi:hypothetical protein
MPFSQRLWRPIGIEDPLGHIAPGYRAEVQVLATWVAGEESSDPDAQ